MSLFYTDTPVTIEWLNLAQSLRTWSLVPRFSPHLELCDPLSSSHQFFTLAVVGYRCVFCKEPSSFWSFCILRNFGLHGSAMLTRHYFWWRFWMKRLVRAACKRFSCGGSFSIHQSVSELHPFWKDHASGLPVPHCRLVFFCFGLGVAPGPPGSSRRFTPTSCPPWLGSKIIPH